MALFSTVLRFLGGVKFALLLIAVTALFVAAGTVIESITQSHQYAEYLTYHHPLFLALLAGFFLNILLSALRRWPFRAKHFPFLVTHLGLLMVLGGAIYKELWGLQAIMVLKEGTASQEVFFPHQPVVRVDLPSGKHQVSEKRALVGDLELTVVDLYPHSSESWEGWFKQGKLHIQGLPPLKEGQQMTLPDREGRLWTIAAGEVSPIEPPSLIFTRDADSNEQLEAHLGENRCQLLKFPKGRYPSLYEISEGFGGYWIQARLDDQIMLHTPLSKVNQVEAPLKKLEENLPLIRVRIKRGKQAEIVPLTYDPMAKGLRWPVLGGQALLRYQPAWQEIPYQVRLQQARQLNYPNSNQPYSYEADLTVRNLQTEEEERVTLSMNRVFETDQGYRFYLSHIAKEPEMAKRIQLAVNYDPAKYWLTYPGGLLVSLGILALFWKRRATVR